MGRPQQRPRAVCHVYPPWLPGPVGRRGQEVQVRGSWRGVPSPRHSCGSAAAASPRRRGGEDRSGRRVGAGAVVRRILERVGLASWLDARTGYRAAASVMLDEPLPPGTGWFFTLGSILLALLSIQLLTGAFLTLYYAP